MKRELASLKTENEIFRKSGCSLNSSNDEKIAAVDKLNHTYHLQNIGIVKINLLSQSKKST